MGKWATFFVFLFFVGTVMTALLAGGGFAASPVTAQVTAAADVVNVADTTGFLAATPANPAYAIIDNEVIKYTGLTLHTLTGVSRGQTDPQSQIATTAAAHAANTYVKTLDVDAIDSFMGYNITTTGATFGNLNAAVFILKMFTNMPKYLTWDYPWFVGMGVLVRYALFAFSSGFILSFCFALVSLGMSIFKS